MITTLPPIPTLFDGFYLGRKVLVTGHTGFKGSWLVLWLRQMGAIVCGLALDPETEPNHWTFLQTEDLVTGVQDLRIDIRDASAVQNALTQFAPELVLHLAAQPLVRRSYREPLETWSSNVMGTAHVLEACRHTSSVKAIVVVTTDKCYENPETGQAFVEEDRLGGHDPYSASKAGAELVVASYRDAFFHTSNAPLLASARAGNVIGGGDWSEDRLIPDIVRAVSSGVLPEIRSPNATRPWQHVLESLSGYLLLGQRLLAGDKQCARAWNFGPSELDQASVVQVLARLQQHWPSLHWKIAEHADLHEAQSLQLNSQRAIRDLRWKAVWHLDNALAETAQWYRQQKEAQKVISLAQLHKYLEAATQAGVIWCKS